MHYLIKKKNPAAINISLQSGDDGTLNEISCFPLHSTTQTLVFLLMCQAGVFKLFCS